LIDFCEGPVSTSQSIQEQKDDEVNGFAYDWIFLVVKATVHFYTQQILSIPLLTDYGGHQLAVDLGSFFEFFDL
jgi:hypothetical protein